MASNQDNIYLGVDSVGNILYVGAPTMLQTAGEGQERGARGAGSGQLVPTESQEEIANRVGRQLSDVHQQFSAYVSGVRNSGNIHVPAQTAEGMARVERQLSELSQRFPATEGSGGSGGSNDGNGSRPVRVHVTHVPEPQRMFRRPFGEPIPDITYPRPPSTGPNADRPFPPNLLESSNRMGMPQRVARRARLNQHTWLQLNSEGEEEEED